MTEALARAVLEAARARSLALATAESCTGGLIAAALTDIAGASEVFDRGFVTYSDAAKRELLGVPGALIQRHGAVSEPVARSMAEGALAASRADLAISVTGVAGPGGGSPDKPVGLVWLATAMRGGATLVAERRFGDLGRAGVRQAAAQSGLRLLLDRLA